MCLVVLLKKTCGFDNHVLNARRNVRTRQSTPPLSLGQPPHSRFQVQGSVNSARLNQSSIPPHPLLFRVPPSALVRTSPVYTQFPKEALVPFRAHPLENEMQVGDTASENKGVMARLPGPRKLVFCDPNQMYGQFTYSSNNPHDQQPRVKTFRDFLLSGGISPLTNKSAWVELPNVLVLTL